MALTLKQQRFVTAYLGEANGNGRQAAEIAGYSGTPGTLGSVASENLTKPEIKDAMQGILTPEGVQKELTKVALMDLNLLGALPSKVRCLELLARVHGLLNDKLVIGLDREAIEAAIQGRIAELSSESTPQLVESIDVASSVARD